ncbi:hypothetical protein Gorai_019298, partial [Gossypium raimondii]|nr:hypothetical protein [Gossypium raimondii]
MNVPTMISDCYYGNPTMLRTSWCNNSSGRRFFGFKKYGSGFRNACDPPLTACSWIVLLGLLK